MRVKKMLAILAVVGVLAASQQASGGVDPFPHGVAARAQSRKAMVWTRAAAPGIYSLHVSREPDLSDPMEFAVAPSAEDDNTVKQVVAPLLPGHRYYYAFFDGPIRSELGTFRTAPRQDVPRALELALSGDSDVLWTDWPEPQDRPFAVLDRIREERPGLFVYLGDTIYSDSETGAPVALTLEEKWDKYKANRLPATQRLLRKVSTWAMWDDHEVINDFDGADLAETDPELLMAGRKAFTDYFPIPKKRFYRKVDWGSEIDLIFLDERTYRTGSADEPGSPCIDDEEGLDLAPQMPQRIRDQIGLPPVDPDCLEHLRDPDHTILGDQQRAWLKKRLKSDARWKLILNEVPIAQLFVRPYDRWEGFEWERNNILEFIRKQNIKGVVFLTTDLHANIGTRVYKDITKRGAEPITYEMISGPIQTCTLDCEVDELLGFEGGGEYLHSTLVENGVTDADCINIDHYSYGLAALGPKSGTLRLKWRSHEQAPDGTGGVPTPECEESIVLRPGSTEPVR